MVAKTNKKKNNKIAGTTVENNNDASKLDEHFGKTLLVNTKSSPEPTTNLLKGKKLVGLYFTASWNGMGKEFTPKLIDFYEKCLESDDMEIVFISSDDNKQTFLDTFAEMPWLAIDGDVDGTRIKHNLATRLKVFRLPSLVVLNVQTGLFVTDGARKQIEELFEINKEDGKNENVLNITKGKELVEQWKTQEPEELGHADTIFNTIYLTAMHFKKYPLYIVGIIVFLIFTNTLRRIQKNPLLGMAMVYLLLKIGKEALDKNAPYIEQKGVSVSSTSKDSDQKKNE